MAPGTQTAYDIDVVDVEYLRHGDKPLLARLFKPRLNPPCSHAFTWHFRRPCIPDSREHRHRDFTRAAPSSVIVNKLSPATLKRAV